MSDDLKISFATIDDIIGICEIYAHSVKFETSTWEYEPPSIDEMGQRFKNISDKYPYFIAKIDNKVVGYAYANLFRGREGWRFSCENSVYVHKDYHSRGIATKLMIDLIEECKNRNLKTMVAVIGDSQNLASIKLHQKLGFEMVGTMPKIGYKFDKWLDSVIMQLNL